MHTRQLRVLLTLALVISAGPASAPVNAQSTSSPPTYIAIDLGSLGGGWSRAIGINDHGQVIGQSGLANGDLHAFLWTPDNGMRDLGTLGGSSSWASDINDAGQVVGHSDSRCFLWPGPDGRHMQDLGIADCEALGINELGQVIGVYYTQVSVPPATYAYPHAFLWTREDGMVELSPADGDRSFSIPAGINDSTHVIINRWTRDTDDYWHPQRSPILWTSTSVTPLDTLIGPLGVSGPFSNATDMNELGQVVGESSSEYRGRGDPGVPHAFLWQAGQGMQDLGTLGGTLSRATGINASGQIVGVAETVTPGAYHAFLWPGSSGGALEDLGPVDDDCDRIPRPEYCNLPYGHAMDSPVLISEAGQVVGRTASGAGPLYDRVFLWTAATGREVLPALGDSSWPTAINNQGQIVGESATVADGWMTPGRHAVLWEANSPPVCSGAEASPALLWPANHTFVRVGIEGVADPDGDTVTIAISHIFQDEAVDAHGSGTTSPDAMGVGTPVAQVRAERMGAGNGRVYHIGFTATDEHGGTCIGEVVVGVPRSHGQWLPGDGGVLYDSTAVSGGEKDGSILIGGNPATVSGGGISTTARWW